MGFRRVRAAAVQQGLQPRGHVPGQPLGLALCDFFGAAHVLRLPAGQGELRQPQGIGAVGRRFAGGDQLVGGGHAVPEDRRQLHQQVLRQRLHLGPVGDVGPQDQLLLRAGMAKAVVDPLLVYALVKVVGTPNGLVFDFRGGGDLSAV